MDDNRLDQAVTEAISKANWKFKGSLFLGLLVIASVTALCWLTITSATSNAPARAVQSVEAIVNTTDLANRRLIEVMSSTQAGTPATAAARIELNAALSQYTKSFEQQSAAAKGLLDELKKTSSAAGDTLIPYANLITGGLILGLLAFLGLTRLGQIDQELKNLRENLIKEVSDRVRLSEEATAAKLSAAIREQIDSSRTAVEATAEQAVKRVDELRATSEQLIEQAETAQQAVIKKYTELGEELSQVATRYPFLMSAEKRDLISRIEHVRSVQQAEALASELNRKDEHDSAIKALEQIVDRSLVGDADDLHNAHSEAMRLKDVALGLRIAEYGLKAFPRNSDMAADVIIALTNSCQPEKAVAFGEGWLADNQSTERTWRFGTFLAQAYKALGLDATNRKKAVDLLEGETRSYPTEEKLWSEFSRTLRTFDQDRSYAVLDDGLSHCPTSQELRFVKAQFLLQDGRPEEAKPVLEQAIASDFQDQFQPSVNGAAVLAYYAQCLEALGQREDARRVYTAASSQLGSHPVMDRFIGARTNMLNVLDGLPPEASSTLPHELLAGMPPELLKALLAKATED
ncbi:hypothetical protein [Zoogloea sp.]|uniref:tetratricopeptide repeat protein n=1 Tax=Zoogloea sp. TaxID=49181 RepID=UPI0035B0A2B1